MQVIPRTFAGDTPIVRAGDTTCLCAGDTTMAGENRPDEATTGASCSVKAGKNQVIPLWQPHHRPAYSVGIRSGLQVIPRALPGKIGACGHAKWLLEQGFFVWGGGLGLLAFSHQLGKRPIIPLRGVYAALCDPAPGVLFRLKPGI